MMTRSYQRLGTLRVPPSDLRLASLAAVQAQLRAIRTELDLLQASLRHDVNSLRLYDSVGWLADDLELILGRVEVVADRIERGGPNV